VARRWGCIAVGLVLGLGSAPAAWAAWQAPATISPAEPDAEQPVVAVNGAGDAIAAWISKKDDYNTAVQVAVRPRGSADFLPAADVNEPHVTTPNPDVTIGQNYNPAVAVGPDGTAIVVWEHEYTIFGMTIPAGARTGERYVLGQLSNTDGYPVVGIDPAGAATVVWEDGGELMAAERPAGAARFGAARAIATMASNFQIAMGSGGTIAVAWNFDGAIRLLVRDGHGTWPAPGAIPLGPDVQRIGRIELAVGPRGDVVAAWPSETPDGGDIRAAVRPAGGSFGPTQTLVDVPGILGHDVQAAVDDVGDAIVDWIGPWETDPAVSARYRPAGGPWQAREVVSAEVRAEEPPALAFDGAGTAYAVWRHYEDREASLHGAYGAVRAAGAGFGPPTPLVPADQNVWEPHLAAGAAGHAIAVYNRGTFPRRFHVEAVTFAATAQAPGSESAAPAQSAGRDTGVAASVSGAGGGAAAATPSTRAAAFASAVNARLPARRIRGRAVRVRVVAPATGRVRFVLRYRARGWHRAGTTTRTLTEGHRITLRFELTRAARRALRRSRAPHLRVSATAAASAAAVKHAG
jgi:hypothetical protein